MEKHLKMIPYLLVHIIAFYLLPMIIKDTGSAMFVMLIGIPTLCLVTAIVFGVKNSFQWLYPIIVALLFAPTIFIHYNDSATPYIAFYAVIALAGNLIGKMFYKQAK